jgi:arylsulfatase A
MDRRHFLKSAALMTAATALPITCSKAENLLPNILFIYADDMGYGDVQALNPGSKIPTPHLNQLAADGMVFTDAHTSSAVCTPSRYSALTGRYCWRSWLKNGVLFPPKDTPLIERERPTIASLLKEKNYSTAILGKWHLGIEWGRDETGEVDFNKKFTYGPTDVGFDTFYGVAASLDMIPYVFLKDHGPAEPVTRKQQGLPFPEFVRKGPKGETFEPEEALDRLTDKAIEFITDQAKKPNPFFLYFPLTAPHKPTWPAKRFVGKTGLGPYGDFVHQTDWSVGQVLKALEDQGITENTLVIYSSDNGSYMYQLPEEKKDHLDDRTVQGYHRSNHQPNYIWRGTKADIWEAGHHVPFLVRWPGKVAGDATNDHTICLTDLFATIAEITNTDIPAGAAEDSYSFMPLLSGTTSSVSRPPIIHHSINGMFSIRDGNWKLVLGNGSGGRQQPKGKPFEKPYFLFDLKKDPSETTNLVDDFPQVVADLTKKFEHIKGDD